MVIGLERGADLHMAQLMPLPLTVSCFSKIQIGFTFLVPAHLGSSEHRAVKRVCMCVCDSIVRFSNIWKATQGTEMVRIIQLMRTVASSPKSECGNCRQQEHVCTGY